MSYVIAAYGVTLGAIVLYLAHLVRERRRLARELAIEGRASHAGHGVG